MSAGEALGATEYSELVARVRETVAGTVPTGASILVVSKGDPALLDLPGLDAAHFPQGEAGGYAGYHPRDGAAAAAELESLRLRGAEYLVIPATARWWLDHYGELASHLDGRGELLADHADACLVYRLERREGRDAAPPLDTSAPLAGAEQIREYLAHLLYEDCPVIVLEAEEGLAAELAPLRAARLGTRDAAAAGGLLASLASLAQAGTRYLVVPRSSDPWLSRQRGLEEELESKLRKIADQRYLCRVFELERPMEVR
ncbi:MAG: hypothetical protein ACM3NV_03340 [Syntrophothermus sp.]